MRAAWRGVDELKAELAAVNRDGNAATLAAIKASSALVKRRVRSRLRGKPRWTHRGASSRTGAAVDLDGPRNTPRSGGPGRFTGSLYRGVGAVRRPRGVAGVYQGGVGVGGGVRNLYKAKDEAAFPYFRPAVKASEAQIGAVWNAAWRKVIAKRGGTV